MADQCISFLLCDSRQIAEVSTLQDYRPQYRDCSFYQKSTLSSGQGLKVPVERFPAMR